ncbi:hypothetical protein ACLOJK_036420 [Asimina triloba]
MTPPITASRLATIESRSSKLRPTQSRSTVRQQSIPIPTHLGSGDPDPSASRKLNPNQMSSGRQQISHPPRSDEDKHDPTMDFDHPRQRLPSNSKGSDYDRWCPKIQIWGWTLTCDAARKDENIDPEQREQADPRCGTRKQVRIATMMPHPTSTVFNPAKPRSSRSSPSGRSKRGQRARTSSPIHHPSIRRWHLPHQIIRSSMSGPRHRKLSPAIHDGGHHSVSVRLSHPAMPGQQPSMI